jgi:hypothetical protein
MIRQKPQPSADFAAFRVGAETARKAFSELNWREFSAEGFAANSGEV